MKYNTIIIGGGLAGLTAGATLSKFGKKVLLLEQHYKPGGCATTFKRGDYIIEVGLHEMNGLDETDGKVQILELLEVEKNVEFQQVPELGAVISRGNTFVFPHGVEEATKALVEKYPEDKKGIRRYMELIAGLAPEVEKLPNKKWKQILYFPFMSLLFPNTVEASMHTVGSWLDKNISNEKLKLDIAANIAYYGDDPYTTSMYWFGAAQASYIAGGGHFVKGGSQKLSDYLASYIEKNGGTVMLGKKAQKIETKNGRVTGVTFMDSFNADLEPVTIDCDNVVANCAIPLIPDLLDEPHASKLNESSSPLKISNSLICIYLGFKSDLKSLGVNHYSNFIMGEDVHSLKDINPNFREDWSKRSFMLVDYSKVDAELAPRGKSVAVICTVDYLKDWEELSKEDYEAKKEQVAKVLLGRLEKQFPGIKDAIEYYEVATPKTIQRFTMNPKGTPYGYAQTKEQIGYRRFKNNLLLPNLYVASAWTFPGGGFSGTITGGFLAALQMNNDKIWSDCDTEKYTDERIVPLLTSKIIDENVLELTFKKPSTFHNQNGKHAILRLLNPQKMKLDLPYRWLPIVSAPDEEHVRFHIPQKESSFENNCTHLKTGDKILLFGPMA